MEIKNKRGTHVGIIASFSVFILFLVALFLIVEPVLKTQNNQDLVVENIENQVMKQLKENLTLVLIHLDNTNCVHFVPNSVVDNIDDLDMIAKDPDNNILPSVKTSFLVEIGGSSKNYTKVYFAKANFTDSGGPSGASNNANISSVIVKKEVFEEKIVKAINDFENFKQLIELSSNNDFALEFEMANTTIIKTEEKNVSFDIYAKEIPINYIDPNADKLPGILRIKIW